MLRASQRPTPYDYQYTQPVRHYGSAAGHREQIAPSPPSTSPQRSEKHLEGSRGFNERSEPPREEMIDDYDSEDVNRVVRWGMNRMAQETLEKGWRDERP
jgi:hypothetical protein